jgi:phage gpG-like protein
VSSGGFFEGIEAAIAKTLGMEAKVDKELEIKMRTAMLMVKRDAIKNAPKKYGHLRRSITTGLEHGKGETIGTIGTNLVYGVAHELGTEGLTGRGSGIRAKHYMANAIKSNADAITALFKK